MGPVTGHGCYFVGKGEADITLRAFLVEVEWILILVWS